MRIAAITTDDGTHCGVVRGEELELLRPGADLYSALSGGTIDLALSGERVPFDPAGELAVPVPVTTIRDFITFEQHTAGSVRAVTGSADVPEAWYQAPAFYFTNPHAATGNRVDVPVAPGSAEFDFELEVAVVIGRPGYNLSPDEAADYIAGYTILNDWSARDLQRSEMRVGLGPTKGKDTATSLGPVLVTPDELTDYVDGDRLALGMSVAVNGIEIGRDSLGSMAWSFAELISYASRGTWVRPGDVLGSGTCGGGCFAEFWGWNGQKVPAPLVIGDEVALTVDGLGTLTNRIVAGPPLHPVPAARRRKVVQPALPEAALRPRTNQQAGR